MILGVTGTYASGKDTVANILIKARFNHISFSDILISLLLPEALDYIGFKIKKLYTFHLWNVHQ